MSTDEKTALPLPPQPNPPRRSASAGIAALAVALLLGGVFLLGNQSCAQSGPKPIQQVDPNKPSQPDPEPQKPPETPPPETPPPDDIAPPVT